MKGFFKRFLMWLFEDLKEDYIRRVWQTGHNAGCEYGESVGFVRGYDMCAEHVKKIGILLPTESIDADS